MKTIVVELSRAFMKAATGLEAKDAILVVKPEQEIEGLFVNAITGPAGLRPGAREDYEKITAYFASLTQDAELQENIRKEVKAISHYVREGAVYRPSYETVRDYVLSKCSYICAEIVREECGGTIVDGTDIMVCYETEDGIKVDWEASMANLKEFGRKGGNLVISAGYGRTQDGYRRSLGARASDLMAMTIASATGCDGVDVFISKAPGIASLTYEEAAMLCSLEDGLVTPSSLLPVRAKGIPVRLISLTDPASITEISDKQAATGGLITGYTVEEGLALINVKGTSLVGKVGVSSAIFGALARNDVNIRFISQPSSEHCISIAIRAVDAEKALSALAPVTLDGEESVSLESNVSILSVFGARMKKVPGASGKVFSALGAAGVNIIAAAQGGDELSISLVIAKEDSAKAGEALSKL